jgi:hypothetical protein
MVMDLLKKHYEKVLLALALVALIGSAFVLSYRVNTLSAEIKAPPKPPGISHGALKPMDFAPYTNAVGTLKAPPQWVGVTQDLFGMQPTSADVQPSPGGMPALVGIVRKPFKLLFKTYSYNDEEKKGYSFQVNFQFRSRTFFVSEVGDEVGDAFERTGYMVKKFEKKSVTEFDAAFNREVEKDVSELTIQYKDEPPVLLVVNRQAEEQEPVAKFRCGFDPKLREIRRRQRFNCEGKNYYVVDITANQMIIRDEQTGKEQVLSLPGAGQ